MCQPVPSRAALILLVLVAAWCAVPVRGADEVIPEDAIKDALETALASLYAPCEYEGTRRLEASAPGRSGWMDVATSYRRGSGFSYRVIAEGGNESVRKRALLKVLEAEVRGAAEAGTHARPVAADYRLGNPVSGSDAWRVDLTPTRRAPTLIDGTFLFSPAGSPISIEGRLAKSPSFWVKSVVARWRFANLGQGVLPVRVDSLAEVRFVGLSRFSMTYSYRRVAGRVVPSGLDTGAAAGTGDFARLIRLHASAAGE